MKPRLLVVDDSEIDIEIAKCALEDEYELLIANSGQECLDMVEQCKPDLILLDIVMRDMDGYEVCKQLKSSDETAFIPVIFLSSLDQFTDKLEGFACGAEEYVSKPFDEAELLKKIATMLTLSLSQQALYERYRENKGHSLPSRNHSTKFFELSELVNFQRNCSRSNDYLELGTLVINTCEALGLDVCIQMKTSHGMRYVGCRENSLESDFLLTSFQNQKEIHTRTRSLFFSKNLTILVKNIPQDNSDSYKWIFESMQMITDAANHRIDIINTEHEAKRVRFSNIQHTSNAHYLAEKYLDKHNQQIKQNLRETLDDIKIYIEALDVDPVVLIEFLGLIDRAHELTDDINRVPANKDVATLMNAFTQE